MPRRPGLAPSRLAFPLHVHIQCLAPCCEEPLYQGIAGPSRIPGDSGTGHPPVSGDRPQPDRAPFRLVSGSRGDYGRLPVRALHSTGNPLDISDLWSGECHAPPTMTMASFCHASQAAIAQHRGIETQRWPFKTLKGSHGHHPGDAWLEITCIFSMEPTRGVWHRRRVRCRVLNQIVPLPVPPRSP